MMELLISVSRISRLSALVGLFIVGYKANVSRGKSDWWFDQPLGTELCFRRSANTSVPQACYQTPGVNMTMTRGEAEAWCNLWLASLIRIESDDVRKEVENFLTKAHFTTEHSIITKAKRDQRAWSWVNRDDFYGYENGSMVWTNPDNLIISSSLSQANESVVADVEVRTFDNETFEQLIFTARCNQDQLYFICSYPNTSGCANRNPPALLYDGTSCYSIHNTQKVTWWKARNLCISYGGDLGIVLNKNFKYLIDQHKLTPNTTYWVGLYRESWMYKSMLIITDNGARMPFYFEMKYSNWAPMAPKDGSTNSCMCLSGGGQNTSDPVLSHIPEITTAAPSVPWQWIDCDCNPKYQVVCQRMGLSNSTTPITTRVTTRGVTTLTSLSSLLNNTNSETLGEQQINNSMRIGLGFGLGVGLFVLLLIILIGLYLIYRRNQSGKSETGINNKNHFAGFGSSTDSFSEFNENLGRQRIRDVPTLLSIRRRAEPLPDLPEANSEDLAIERTTDEHTAVRPEPPPGYERLQKVRTLTFPPSNYADDSKSDYYEEIPDTPRISMAIENPRNSGISSVNAVENFTETSNTNSSDGGYSSAETSGDSAGLRNVGNSKQLELNAENHNTDTDKISAEKAFDVENSHVVKISSAGEISDALENTHYHRYYNKDVISSRDSYLTPITPIEVPSSLKLGDYLHPLKTDEDGKQLEDEGSVYRSSSDDYLKYLEVLPDIS